MTYALGISEKAFRADCEASHYAPQRHMRDYDFVMEYDHDPGLKPGDDVKSPVSNGNGSFVSFAGCAFVWKTERESNRGEKSIYRVYLKQYTRVE